MTDLRKITLLIALLLSSIVHAEDNSYVMKFAMIDIKPYYYYENGQFYGEAIDYMNRICQKANVAYLPHIYPIKRLLKYLYSGDIDVVFLPKGIVDPQMVTFANQGTSSLDIGLYFDNNIEVESKLKDLNNKRIIVVKNYNYSGLLTKLKQLYPEIIWVVASSPQATFKMLEYKRGDAVLAYKRITEASDISVEQLSYKSLYKQDIYMIFSPKSKHPKLEEMIYILNAANDEVVAEDKKLASPKQVVSANKKRELKSSLFFGVDDGI